MHHLDQSLARALYQIETGTGTAGNGLLLEGDQFTHASQDAVQLGLDAFQPSGLLSHRVVPKLPHPIH